MGVWICTKWFGLLIIAEKMKMYSYLLVVKYPFPQYDS